MIFDQFYSSPKRKGMVDAGFLVKIYGPFICLTAAILYHSLQCWRSRVFKDKVAFTHSNAGDKINNADLRFSTVSRSLLAKHLDTIENGKCMGQAIGPLIGRQVRYRHGGIQVSNSGV